MKFYVKRPNGRELGTVDAPTLGEAFGIALTLHGEPVRVLEPAAATCYERLFCRVMDGIADGAQ